jgi:cellobiose transport system substrate-binding protein
MILRQLGGGTFFKAYVSAYRFVCLLKQRGKFKMLQRKILALVLSVILVFSLAACGGNSAEKEGPTTEKKDPAEKVELTMWVFGSSGYEKLAEEYMKANPNVTIKIQSTDFGDHHNNVFTAISAGSGAPDIAMIEVGAIERYREAQDQFYNLYDFGAEDIKDKYLDWKWAIGESADGSFLFGLPTDIGPTVMYYRADVFEAAGLPTNPDEVSKLIATWEDFKIVGKQIKDKTGKPMVDGPSLVFNALRDQSPEQYFDREDNLIIENSPYVKNAYDYTAGLIKEGIVGNFPTWSPEWGTAMNDGSFAVLLAPAWMQGVIKGNAPDAAGKWSITTMPEGAGNWGGSYLAIPKQSKNSEAAYAFTQWLVSPENQLKSFKDMGLFPSAPSVYEDPAFSEYKDEYFGGLNTAKVFAEAAKQVKSVYTGKNFALVTDEINLALSNVNQKNADPEQEWQDALNRIKTQLAKQ